MRRDPAPRPRLAGWSDSGRPAGANQVPYHHSEPAVIPLSPAFRHCGSASPATDSDKSKHSESQTRRVTVEYVMEPANIPGPGSRMRTNRLILARAVILDASRCRPAALTRRERSPSGARQVVAGEPDGSPRSPGSPPTPAGLPRCRPPVSPGHSARPAGPARPE